jgi:hypothetical protein
MYTGEMIETLIEKVEKAEATAFVRVTQAKRPANNAAFFTTFIYEFGRNGNVGQGRGTIEVA